MAYFDNSGYGRLQMFPPVTKTLMIVNVLIFLVGLLLPGVGELFGDIGALYPWQAGVWGLEPGGRFFPTQYITYQFLHAGFSHIFLNMLGLWMFGSELEQMWGSRRYLIFYLLCGIGAGLIQSVVTTITGDMAVTVGASGAVYGLLTAFAVLNPDRIIFLMFFPLKARYAIMVIIAMGVVGGISGSDNIAHFAHLGGALVGYVLLKIGGKLTLGGIFDRRREEPRMQAPPPPPTRERARVVDVRFRETEPVPPPASHRHAPNLDMNYGSDQERIDAILDKISRSGYQTLTDEEKAILTEVSKRMR
jgi:membrane associated rhomboid family serine protease